MTINPKWLEYNRTNNEGGEGYNPHAKYIAAPVAAAAGVRKMVRGKARTYDEAIKFSKLCLSGQDKDRFVAEVNVAFGRA